MMPFENNNLLFQQFSDIFSATRNMKLLIYYQHHSLKYKINPILFSKT